MALCHRRGFKLFKQTQNDFLWNRIWAVFVLFENSSKRWLKINNLDSRSVIDKEVNPALPPLPRDVRSVKREVLTNAQMFAALLARGLDDLGLFVRGIDVERFADGVQRDDRCRGAVLGKPGDIACGR